MDFLLCDWYYNNGNTGSPKKSDFVKSIKDNSEFLFVDIQSNRYLMATDNNFMKNIFYLWTRVVVC